MKPIYKGPRDQTITMDFGLNPKAPDRDVFPESVALVVRRGKNKGVGLEWGAVIKAVIEVLPESPEMQRDLQAALNAISEVESQALINSLAAS